MKIVASERLFANLDGPRRVATSGVVMNTSLISHGVNAAFLQAIGLVSVHWSGLEVLVDTVITRLLKASPDQSHAVLTGLGFQLRLDMLAALAVQIKQPRRRTSLETIIANIRSIQKDRNFIIHAMWVGGAEANQGHVLRRNERGVRLEHWTADKVSETADKIAASQLDVIGWMMGGGDLLGSQFCHSPQ